MPLINGEKWACSSCIKGHRVSGCTHTDRELKHINPKGRPVKQCEHCRGARKSKSHHAKCDCGDKKDVKHKDKGDAQGEILAEISVDEVSNHAAVDENTCCCHSGGKCICGLKKDSLDLKLDTGRHAPHGARAKPKLTSTQSESTLTVFANGHHKPCHRNNNSAHVSGAPYKIPRPHTLHGHAAFAAFSQGNGFGHSEAVAQRSADTLSLTNNEYYTIYGSAALSLESPITPLTGTLDGNSIGDSLFSSSSNFAQDGNSPDSQLSDSLSTQQWWNSPATTGINRNFAYGSLSTSPSQDCLTNLDNQWMVPTASAKVWSATDLPLDPNKLNDTLTQPISHSGESNQPSVPGLTTASSTHSENEEPAYLGDVDFGNPQSATTDRLFWEDSPAFRSAPSVTSELRSAPTSMPTANAVDFQALDINFSERVGEGSPFKADLSGLPALLADTTQSDGLPTFPGLAMPNPVDDLPENPWLLDDSNPFDGLNSYDASFQSWS
ncbi:hypothetical protein BCR34DRAFT_492059 [Clohesyomyces aquaticus]|uniref:Copper-fist domain-containing protein n=1 Tax=Clohesyomyces aquaticus TaxID=1231657 RepID=A0A1Y1Z1Y5_9PLEO|nr:hypothetical protein BCR34DRAFT_492059 [Clohesyomyces aquaticus]